VFGYSVVKVLQKSSLDSAVSYDRQELIAIYEQYNQELYRYAFRLLGERCLAEDCVAETFSRYLRVVRAGRGPSENVRAYLYRMVHNWATDHYRRNPLPAPELDLEMHADPESNPLHVVTREAERERVRAALMQLPTEQRRVIELRFLEEWSHEAVAEALGRTVEATRALQHRALAVLRRLLVEKDPRDDSESASDEGII
jgi:RNA polymerase sigma-70 factor (ECF subfamily)